jgi:V8-like Glu-specific endopeptidase
MPNRETTMLAQFLKRSGATAVAVLVLCLTANAAGAVDIDLYTKTLQATGWIYVPGSGDGTCWVVDLEERLVVTNKHVVGGMDYAEIMFPLFQAGQVVTSANEYLKQAGKLVIKGKVIARDSKRDLALVQLEKLPENIGVLALAEASAKLNETVLSIGNSGLAGKPIELGTLWKMRTGKVARKAFWVLHYNNVNQKLESSMLNSSLHTSPGDSGGPVVNEKGQLVGVTSGGDTVNSFAIDVSEVRSFLSRAMASERSLVMTETTLAGTWTQTWVNSSGNRFYAGLTLRINGTVVWEDDRGSFEGTYTISDGKLKIALPSLEFEVVSEVRWNGSNSFHISRGAIEYTVVRR